MPKKLPARNSPAAKPPPLWAWGITAGLLLVAGALFINSFLNSYHAFHEQLTQTAETVLRREYNSRKNAAGRVVVLGTSLTGCGVLSPEYFAKQTHGRYRVIKIFRQAANLESFTERTPIFKLLLKYPPDILCIEENLLLFDLKDYSTLTPDTLLAKNILFYLPRLVEQGKSHFAWWYQPEQKPQNPFADIPPPKGEHSNTGIVDTIQYGAQLRGIKQRPVRPYASQHPLHQYLQILRNKGTRVVILHFPRPAPLEKAIYSGKVRQRLLALRASYKQTDHTEYWHEPGNYPFGDFYDYAHLNLKGREIYSAWLARRLLTGQDTTTEALVN